MNTRFTARALFCVCAAALFAFLVPPAWSQILYGSLVGNIKDPTDAAVTRATVVATHTQTGQARETLTNELGAFSFPTLQAGLYEIRVSKEGFRTATTTVTVTINSVTRADLALQLGLVA